MQYNFLFCPQLTAGGGAGIMENNSLFCPQLTAGGGAGSMENNSLICPVGSRWWCWLYGY
jgi:hypothetical protein